mgnify:CR=1 FL=1
MNKNMIINGINNESVTLYEELLNYGFEDVIFIDSDIEKVKNFNNNISKSIAFFGDSSSSEFLEFVGINRVNSETIFVAMTESDSVNLISCEIAKLKYNLVNIVSIVNSKENLSLFNAYGITELFFQGRSILEVIINSAGVTLPVSLLDIRNKGTSLWSIKIPKDSIDFPEIVFNVVFGIFSCALTLKIKKKTTEENSIFLHIINANLISIY